MARQTNPAAELERLRRFRARPEPAPGVALAVDEVVRDAKKRALAVGGLDSRWAVLMPRALGEATAPVSLSRGVLTVRAEGAPARYEFDRWLRAGGEGVLRRACKATLRRVRVV